MKEIENQIGRKVDRKACRDCKYSLLCMANLAHTNLLRDICVGCSGIVIGLCGFRVVVPDGCRRLERTVVSKAFMHHDGAVAWVEYANQCKRSWADGYYVDHDQVRAEARGFFCLECAAKVSNDLIEYLGIMKRGSACEPR